MRFVLKDISLPVVAVLSVMVMLLSFLVSCARSVWKIVSCLAFLLGGDRGGSLRSGCRCPDPRRRIPR